jgi:hypothetical protein
MTTNELPVDPSAERAVVHVIRGRGRRLDLIAVCDRYAREENTTLEKMMWNVVKGLSNAAIQGDVPAARELIKLFARLDTPHIVQMPAPAATTASSSNGVPMLPDAGELADAIEDLHDFTDQLRRERPTIRLVRPEPKTIEDLM